MKQIIEQLEAERKKQGMSYQKLGELAHMTRQVASRTLKNQTVPEGGTLIRIVDVLGFELVILPKDKKLKRQT